MFKQNKQPAGEVGQTLGQAARGGCGTSILQLFKPHTSREPSCSQLDPSSGPSHGCCTQKSSGHKPRGGSGLCPGRAVGRQVPRGRGHRLSTRGAAAPSAPTFPGVHCSLAPSPLAAACSRLSLGPALKQAFHQEVQCDLTYFFKFCFGFFFFFLGSVYEA